MVSLPDLHRKETKLEAIGSAVFLLSLAKADRHHFEPVERAALLRSARFLATLAGREDLVTTMLDLATPEKADG